MTGRSAFESRRPRHKITRLVISIIVTGLFYSMSYFVYIIQSKKDDRFYIGSTNNLTEKVERHNQDRSRYTKGRGPWRLVYKEAHADRSTAVKREKEIKNRKSKHFIEHLVRTSRWSSGKFYIRVPSSPPFLRACCVRLDGMIGFFIIIFLFPASIQKNPIHWLFEILEYIFPSKSFKTQHFAILERDHRSGIFLSSDI